MPTTLLGLTNVDPTVVTKLVIVDGNNQSVAPSGTYAKGLKVQAQNGLGNGVAGFSVTFTAPGTAASCRFSGSLTQVVATDSSGFATTVQPVATATLGSFVVPATGTGVTTVNFNETIGVVYLPEVCTPYEACTTGAITTVLGQSGAGPLAWQTPDQSIAASAGASYATNITSSGANKSQGLLGINPPASWLALKPDALITKIQIQATVRGTGAGIGTLLLSVVRNGLILSNYNQITWTGWTGTFSVIGAIYTNPSSGVNQLTPADLALPNTGFMATDQSNLGTSAGTGFNINGWKVSVCYQDVDKSATNPRPTPLQYCEA